MVTRSSSAKSFPIERKEQKPSKHGQSASKLTEKKGISLSVKKKKKGSRQTSKRSSNTNKKSRIVSAYYEPHVPQLSTEKI